MPILLLAERIGDHSDGDLRRDGAAKRDLGYRPLIDTEEGLRRTAEEARAYYESL